jgi:hypothetical protein
MKTVREVATFQGFRNPPILVSRLAQSCNLQRPISLLHLTSIYTSCRCTGSQTGCTVDLRNSRIANKLKDQCTHILAQGNEGRCEIEVFDQEGTQLTYKVAVRSRQVSGPIVAYDATVYFQGTVDAADPSSWKSQQVCVDTPMGKQCINLGDLIELLLL